MITFFTIFLFLLISRANSYLLGYEILNIDESQMMANAVRLHLNDYNVFNFDGTSSGFLNSLVLNWPNLLGLDVTFLSTRLTSILILSLIFYLIFLYFRTELSKFLSLLIIFPGITFFAFTGDPDYQHYSSELLSTLFIIFCLYGFKKYSTQNSNFYLIGFLPLGLIIFAKSQIIPTAISLFGISCIYMILKKEYAQLVKISFFFTFPFISIILLYFLNGYLHDYYLNYFEFSKAVVSKYSLGENISTNIINTEKKLIESNLVKHLLYNSLFHYFYFQTLLAIFILFYLTKEKFFQLLKNINFILIVICIISILFSIAITGVIYRHYFTPLIPLTTLFIGALFVINKNKILSSRYIRILLTPLSLFLIISFMQENNKFYTNKLEKTHFNLENINLNSPEIFKYLDIEGNKLFIWGWSPQWYVLSYMLPSDRATISQKNIEDYSNKEYFNQRLISDLNKNTPDIIMDTVKQKSFYYTESKNSITNNSPIKEMVKEKYVLLNKDNSYCPDIYLSKTNFEKLKNRIINFTTKNVELKKRINDFSIGEDICDDSYIFNSDDDEKIKFMFQEKTDIHNMLILSSKKNMRKIEVNLKLINNTKEIMSKKVKLNKHPFWTSVSFDKNNEQIDGVIIDVRNLKELNYGLNEIKFYRK